MSIEPAYLRTTKHPFFSHAYKTAPSTVEMNGENGEVML